MHLPRASSGTREIRLGRTRWGTRQAHAPGVVHRCAVWWPSASRECFGKQGVWDAFSLCLFSLSVGAWSVGEGSAAKRQGKVCLVWAHRSIRGGTVSIQFWGRLVAPREPLFPRCEERHVCGLVHPRTAQERGTCAHRRPRQRPSITVYQAGCCTRVAGADGLGGQDDAALGNKGGDDGESGLWVDAGAIGQTKHGTNERVGIREASPLFSIYLPHESGMF